MQLRQAPTCSNFMSVEEDTKSKRLLIFFSLAFRVTALFVYDNISLQFNLCIFICDKVVAAQSRSKDKCMLHFSPVCSQHIFCVPQFIMKLHNLLQCLKTPDYRAHHPLRTL